MVKLHSVHSPSVDNSRDAAVRALKVLSEFIDPKVQAAILAKIDAGCAATAIAARSVATVAVLERPSRIITDWREVDEIMGGPDRKFFGPDFLKDECGLTIPVGQLPKLHITEAEVMNALRLGHMISLHSNTLASGMTSTVNHIDQDDTQRHGRKMVFDATWCQTQAFANTPDVLEWRQTSTHPIPGSFGMNYLQQTELLATYLQDEVTRGQPLSAREKMAIQEFEQRKLEIETLFMHWDADHKTVKLHDGNPALNWQVAAGLLANLHITRGTRPTAIGLITDIANAKTAKIPMLKHDFTTTADTYSFGPFAAIGPAGDKGACIDSSNPIATNAKLGAIFSCSRSDERGL